MENCNIISIEEKASLKTMIDFVDPQSELYKNLVSLYSKLEHVKDFLSQIISSDIYEELNRRGICTTSLWSIADVRYIIDNEKEKGEEDYTHLSDDDCMDVLDEILEGETIHNDVWELIPLILQLNYSK